jgi:hypothetical protein
MPSGEAIVSPVKNRPIFQVNPIIPMQKPAGLVGAIGSALDGLLTSYANIGLS